MEVLERTTSTCQKFGSIIKTTVNYSVAKNTWRSYETAKKHIHRAEKWANFDMTIPFTLRKTLTYIAYLRGKTKQCTIRYYWEISVWVKNGTFRSWP